MVGLASRTSSPPLLRRLRPLASPPSSRGGPENAAVAGSRRLARASAAVGSRVGGERSSGCFPRGDGWGPVRDHFGPRLGTISGSHAPLGRAELSRCWLEV